MVDAREKKLKKVAVTEEDVCTLLQRYTATTVLALLREVAQFPVVKIDWQALVENSKTGIKTARECQMLWRHLAYRKPLIESVDPEDQPMDDDSDLEYELEACPPVSDEAAIEASNCVKVLASGLANESGVPNSSTAEGRTLNVPSSNVPSENLQAAGTFGEGLDANGLPINRKRRKPWSEEEDQELITAVQKFGEGSWAAILKAEFKGNRSANQLAQRWSVIRKRQGSLNIGGTKIAIPQLTEAQLATRHALDMAFKDISTGCGTVGNETTGTKTPKTIAPKSELPVSGATVPPSKQHPSPLTSTSALKSAPLASTPKSRPQKKAAQPNISADSIHAAAVAAGARIASPSDAASLFMAVQSKNAVHIRGGSSLIKTSAAKSSSPLPPNVHFIRTGLASTSTSTATASLSAGQQAKGSSVLSPPVPPAAVVSQPPVPPAAVSPVPPAAVVSQPPVPPAAVSQPPVPAKTTSAAGMERINAAQQMENRTSTVVKVQSSDTKPATRLQEDKNPSLPQCLPKTQLDKCQATTSDADVVSVGKQIADVGSSQCETIKTVARNEQKDDGCKQVSDNAVVKIVNENLSVVVQTLQSTTVPTTGVDGVAENVNGTHEDPTTEVDGVAEKMNDSRNIKISNQTRL
ncbi:hypothetical protein SOVF_141520 [Spinacia oleracea]|uniref:Uncharacterized protein PB18E9.04c n=1 Tax=Spinacia oleracea TaxID=3562 RepID=A0A9R0K2N0_SPIOL|nr:uncharacterized protein PB18E9.04c-like [Spinacia oleracea]KNA10718.1 hypothetical protein SOVF_141520 [Spinacia oleracea]